MLINGKQPQNSWYLFGIFKKLVSFYLSRVSGIEQVSLPKSIFMYVKHSDFNSGRCWGLTLSHLYYSHEDYIYFGGGDGGWRNNKLHFK